MQGVNNSTIMRAIGNGVALGIVEEGVGDHKGRKAVMAGAYMAGGSLVTDVLGGSNPLAKPQFWGPSAKAFSDSVFYTGIEALAERNERTWRDLFRNFLYGFGSSFLVATVTAPIAYLSPFPGPGQISQSPGAPAVPVNQPVSTSFSTSSY